MRDIAGRNAKNAAELKAIAGTDLRPIELDVQSDASAMAAAEKALLGGEERIDVTSIETASYQPPTMRRRLFERALR